MSDQTPTERFEAPAPTVPLPVAEERRSRRLILVLAIVGGVLLLALIAVLVVLLTRGSGTPAVLPTPSSTPTASVTPSASPTPTATPTTPPAPSPTATTQPSTSLEITSFLVATVSKCNNGQADLEFQWESKNGAAAYIGVNTNDAQASGQGWDLPPSGDESDFPDPLNFQCGNDSTTYTITIVGTDGTKASKKVTVQNPGN